LITLLKLIHVSQLPFASTNLCEAACLRH